MKLRIVWGDSEKRLGEASVVEPCCAAVRPGSDSDNGYNDYRVPFFMFNVSAENNELQVALYVGFEDGNLLPLRFCPSCGSPVEVLDETVKPSRPRGVILSSAISTLSPSY